MCIRDRGASQSLGFKSMGTDFGDDLDVGLWSDASAAIAISQRSGLGKLRHIQTQYLWLQERVSAKGVQLTKVVGTANPADMLTKHLAIADLQRHLDFGNLIIRAGRADGSLHVSAILHGGDVLAPCSTVGSRTEAAVRLASGSFMMVGTSKVGLPPLAVGGIKFSLASTLLLVE